MKKIRIVIYKHDVGISNSLPKHCTVYWIILSIINNGWNFSIELKKKIGYLLEKTI